MQTLLALRTLAMGDVNAVVENGQWSMVNPVCPIGQPVSGTGGEIVKLFPIHHRLQKSKKSGSSERHKSSSIAAISYEGKFFQRQKFVIILSQQSYYPSNNAVVENGQQSHMVLLALVWQLLPTHPSHGRPQQAWDTKLEMLCRYKTF